MSHSLRLSVSRRDVRRRCLGAVRKVDSTRTRGHFSVREELPKYSVTPTAVWFAEIPSRIPRYSSRGLWRQGLYFGMKELVSVAWMNPIPGGVLKTDQVRASNGAEKSCQTRRRKRGLRKGKRRSRGCHPRRTAHPPANVSKPPSYRKVNHRRRPERWLIAASESLSADSKKFIEQDGKSYFGRIKRIKLKKHCMAKWKRFSDHADSCGLPKVGAFDLSYFRWLNKEFPRDVGEIDERWLLTTRQPFTYFNRPIPDWRQVRPVDPLENLIRNRPNQEAIRTPGTIRLCRHCGSRHRDGSCPKLGSSNRKRGLRPLRRR